MMTVTSKGQVTLPVALRQALKINSGDRLVVRIKKGAALLEPAGRGILDIVGKMGKLRIPRGKTVDDLIHEATLDMTNHVLS